MKLKPINVNGVLNICYSHGWGTCFLAGDEAGLYFVTAKHILNGAFAGDNVIFRQGETGFRGEIKEVIHSDIFDVSVFTTDAVRFHTAWATSNAKAIELGQEALFLGFPHQLINTYPGIAGFPSPLVRHAHFSGIVKFDSEPTLLFDGFNNPGYSGGPVYIADDKGDLGVVGVISGYRYERLANSMLYRKVGNNEEVVPDTYVKSNSGMIYVTPGQEFVRLGERLESRNGLPQSQLPMLSQAEMPPQDEDGPLP